MIGDIRKAWGWTGMEPREIVATNAFGNVIVLDTASAYWRICPEECSCQIIARGRAAFSTLWADPDFQSDWKMDRLVELASAKFGPLPEERCYCLKLAAVLGGAYAMENIGTISRLEVVSVAGDIARQIKDLPDGATIKLKATE